MPARPSFWLTLSLALLGSVCHPVVAKEASDEDVQRLANFPALQRLSREGQPATGNYLRAVGRRYQAEGLVGLGGQLRRAQPLLALFGLDSDEVRSSQLRRGRAALRAVRRSLNEVDGVVVPDTVGDRLPNFVRIVEIFVDNSTQAIKNLSTGRKASRSIRRTTPAWVTRTSETEATVTASGSLTFNVDGSTLPSSSGLLSTADLTPFSNSTLTITSGRWAAFPASSSIPTSEITSKVILSDARLVNGVEYPAGTVIGRVAEDYMVPEGAVELSVPITISPVPADTEP